MVQVEGCLQWLTEQIGIYRYPLEVQRLVEGRRKCEIAKPITCVDDINKQLRRSCSVSGRCTVQVNTGYSLRGRYIIM